MTTLYKGYWLCMMRDGRVVSIDGGHTRKIEAQKALMLHDHIFGNRFGYDGYKIARVKKNIPLLAGENWAQAIDRLVLAGELALAEIESPKNKPRINLAAADMCQLMVGALGPGAAELKKKRDDG